MNDDTPSSSNAAIAGSDAAEGVAGSAVKSVGTFTLSVAIAYSAPDGSSTPPSRVDAAAIKRYDAPNTDTSSYKLPPEV